MTFAEFLSKIIYEAEELLPKATSLTEQQMNDHVMKIFRELYFAKSYYEQLEKKKTKEAL